jgi:CII-binding regulator of phage lambda lysogenization HflD
MQTKYSLTTLLNNMLKLQNNGYQIITKLSDVVSSNADTVEVDVMDGNGVIQKVYVPSYGALKNQLVRMEQDIKSLSGVGDTTSSIQLSDGTFRKILVSSLQKEAADIKQMPAPTTFNKRENWFFESFMNPLLYVSFNLSNQIKYETEKIEVARYILNLDSAEKVRIFNDRFSGKSDIVYQDFVQVLLDNGITYFLDREMIDMPARTLRYFGDFTVTNVFDDTLTSTVNNATVQKRVLRVQLDKLSYNDNQSRYLGTSSLKIGDSLVVNSQRQNTRYRILDVEASTRTVSVELVEGFDAIKIGKNVLSFYGEEKAEVNAEVNIGFNEYCVIFVKPIDPDSRIQSVNWSPGVGLYTNNLKIVDPSNGSTTSLATFYQNEVVDFGAFLYSSVKDKTPPSIFGIVPDAPVLNPANFEVLQINEHLTSSGSLSNLQKLQADKLRVQSQVSASDKAISEIRTKIQTTRYSSQKLQDTDNNQLSKLIDERGRQSSLYASIIDDINKIAASESVENLTPKYRLRGFFPIPDAKTSDRTKPQEVVQFIIQYRYVKKDGSANQPQQIGFVDNDGQQRRGTFASWVEYKSEIRARQIDPATGIANWAVDDVENADVVNINQIDIPIQQGEGVEFRIKSLSEAGWPVTPLESTWSEIVKVDFPAKFESIPDANSIVEQAKKEQIKVELQAELVVMSLDKVSNYTISQNGDFYTTDAVHVASGFLTPENNIINLFDKLTAMDSELANIRALIANAKGSISIRIVDDQGQEYTVENNSTIRIFAGNYRDQVSSLPIKKGVIITKNYFIKISNDAASVLELYSRFYGSKYTKINSSWASGTNYNLNDTDYNRLRRYDFVPLGLSNPDSNDIATYGFIRTTPQQSSQVTGQFINSRYTSVDGTRNLYSNTAAGATYGIQNSRQYIVGSTFTGSTANTLSEIEYLATVNLLTSYTGPSSSSDFIWRGGVSPTNVIPAGSTFVTNTFNSQIFIHTDHPDIPSWITEGAGATTTISTVVSGYVRNSILSNISKGSTGSNIQTGLFFRNTGATSDSYGKIGFSSSDQFLIGPASVGAYLFVNPNSHTDLIVNGSDAISYKDVQFGNANALTIPITFQYRMTDYFGTGSAGLGNIAGLQSSNSSTNLEYTKTIGIDVYVNPLDKERFSFDLEVTARYYSKSLITKDIPVRTFEAALDDLSKTIKVVTPRTSRDTIVRNGGRRGGGGGCPDPMTPINITEELAVLAGSLSVGDTVYTMHETTKEFGFFKIMEATPIVEEKLKISFTDGTDITVSDSHKFLMANDEWKRSYALTVGESIKGYIEDRTISNIESIGTGTVIKFEIEDAHTYISNGLISHNKVAINQSFE